MLGPLQRIGAFGRKWARTIDPWTNVYGFARSILALSTVLTLTFNRMSTLFRPGASGIHAPFCDGLRGAGLFCMVPEDRLGLIRWVLVALLLLVASGYRPRYTGVIHWWIAFSLQANAITIDGGDNAAAVLALILLPVTLTDSRVWHWEPSPFPTHTPANDCRRLVALIALTVARVQVAGIYFHAAVGKFEVEEWTNGTAIYYWGTSPLFGATGIVAEVFHPIVVHAVGVSLLTWGVLVLEYFLSAALVMPKRFWGFFLWAGVTLHLGIMMVHGLVTFSLVMFAALALYLRPVERPFAFDALLRKARAGRRSLQRIARASASGALPPLEEGKAR